MIVRGVDSNGDWLYGKGRNDYRQDVEAVKQNLKTRLQSFLGDCFFDLGAGIDWFTYLGSKERLELELSVRSIIMNTQGVVAINAVSSNLGSDRVITLNYSVKVDVGVQLNIRSTVEVNPIDYITTEDGDRLTTEDGDQIITEGSL